MRAIDVHGHFGRYDRGMRALTDELMSADITEVSRRALEVDIQLTVVSSTRALMPYRGDVLRGNEDAVVAAESRADIRFWSVIDPFVVSSYEQTDRLLDHPKCCGIKIHPHAHNYEISEVGEPIFAFAAERKAVVLTHSGDIGSYPEDFLPFIDRYPEMQLILAHLGNSDDGGVARQVDAVRASRHGNVWVDTSSSRSMFARIIEWAVGDIGYDRILFGTDTPLYWSASQKVRIETAQISDEAKAAILWGNAAGLLGIEVS